MPAPEAPAIDAIWFVAIGALVVLQLSLQVLAFVDIVRKPGPWDLRKIVWLIVIILGELIGVLMYFAFGRGQLAGTVTESVPAADAEKAAGAVNALYGPQDAPAPPDGD